MSLVKTNGSNGMVDCLYVGEFCYQWGRIEDQTTYTTRFYREKNINAPVAPSPPVAIVEPTGSFTAHYDSPEISSLFLLANVFSVSLPDKNRDSQSG